VGVAVIVVCEDVSVAAADEFMKLVCRGKTNSANVLCAKVAMHVHRNAEAILSGVSACRRL